MKSSVFIVFMVLFGVALFAQAPDTLWTKTFNGIGNGVDVGRSVKQTSDGGYIIAGYTNIGFPLNRISGCSRPMLTAIPCGQKHSGELMMMKAFP